MNKQKQREMFEGLPLAKLAIECEYVYYNQETNSYFPNEDYCPDSAPESMNFAWLAWQQAQKQAIPEGFVLVPREPTEEILKALDTGFEFDYSESYFNSHTAYKTMIEAQEQNDEH
jgi:hypothetical protein